ncbi:MAG: MFS transporter [Chromatiales bacterium]|nr:MFS transporter [Chromatiales bacterium]
MHSGQRFGLIGLEPGVASRHVWILLYAAYVTIGLATFDAFATPYVLSTALGIPITEQGAVVGRLNVYTEIVLLVVFTPLGVLSDRIGRRAVYAFGFICLAAAYALFPYAGSETELALIRVIYSVGLGGVTGMIATLLGDYAVPGDRGKLTAMTGILNGLGVVTGAIFLARLPQVFAEMGYNQFQAGQFTLWIVAGLCLLSALVVAAGLRKGTPVAKEDRPPVRELFRSGFDLARKNPRIAVAYASAFVARGDLVVVGTFLVLWGKVAAVNAGMEPAAAIEAGRLPFVIAQSAALMWAIVAVFLLDRFHRMTGLAVCMGLAAVGYLLLIFVEDPLDKANIPFFLLLGIGQISAFLGSTTLIGKEAPAAQRGSVIGAFSVAGALGILITSGIGGTIFDSIDPRAPFMLLGVMNLAVLAAAVLVRIYAPGPPMAREFQLAPAPASG